MNKTAYPLCWPPGRPACQIRKGNSHFRATFANARDNCLEEIRMLGGSDIIISTNIPLKVNGTPYAVDWCEKLPQPGVAVYFTRKGKSLCFACDCWVFIQDNMNAIALTIGALRGIARWGTGDMMEAAFTGFTALPPAKIEWWSILGVPINSEKEQVKEAYRTLAKIHHPDTGQNGGDAELFRRVQEAWTEFNRLQS